MFFERKRKFLFLSSKQWTYIGILYALSVLIRCFGLSHPDVVVFDETHFGYFTNSYLKKEKFFDIHPPLAKLIFYATSKATGYDGSFNFSAYESKYNSSFYISLRRAPMIASTFISPLLTASLMIQRASNQVSILCGIISNFDLITITQSRFILTDSFLYLFTALTIFFSSLLKRKQKWIYIILQAFFAGCAISTKFTSGGLFIYVAFLHIFLLKHQKDFISQLFIRGAVISMIVLTILFSSIYIHFNLQPKENNAHMFIIRAIRYIYEIIKANQNVTDDHPCATRWYQWPFSISTPILIWAVYKKQILLYASPVASVFSLFGIIIGIYRFQPEVIGYMFSYIPFVFIKRVTFLYHYQIPLMFGILMGCKYLDNLEDEDRKLAVYFISGLSVAVYIFFIPNIYGLYNLLL